MILVMNYSTDIWEYLTFQEGNQHQIQHGLEYIKMHQFILIIAIMPQSHCTKSIPERGRIDHSSLFGGAFLVILVHSGNDNDNDN